VKVCNAENKPPFSSRIEVGISHLGASKPDAFRIDAEFLPPPMRISLALGKAG